MRLSACLTPRVLHYVPLQTGKAMWEALEAKYGVSDAGTELYIIE